MAKLLVVLEYATNRQNSNFNDERLGSWFEHREKQILLTDYGSQ